MNSRDRKRKSPKSKKRTSKNRSVKKSVKSNKNIDNEISKLQNDLESHRKKQLSTIMTITEELTKEKKKLSTVDSELKLCKDEIKSLKDKLKKKTEPIVTENITETEEIKKEVEEEDDDYWMVDNDKNFDKELEDLYTSYNNKI
jgi:chromosome segregation ATPase